MRGCFWNVGYLEDERRLEQVQRNWTRETPISPIFLRSETLHGLPHSIIAKMFPQEIMLRKSLGVLLYNE